jgi:uncharacterized protein (TIGR03663 family)
MSGGGDAGDELGADADGESEDRHRGDVEGPLERVERLTLFRAVLAITVAALIARLVLLGARPAHWDEARVAYWAQYYAETGSFGYHWEEHGPLVQIAARWLFEPLGVGDTAARLPVALVGGLLPMAALLYRRHLRDSEVVALALFLSFNSVLLYFSRFVRSDVLVAAFMFTALGLLLRFADTRRYRYLYGAGLFVALGFGSKENAVVYLATWAGAAVLVADQWLHSPASGTSGAGRLRSTRFGGWWHSLRRFGSRGQATLAAAAGRADDGDSRGYDRSTLRAGAKRTGLIGSKLAGVVVVALATALFVFADRGAGVRGRQPYLDGDSSQVTLGEVLNRPGVFPAFVNDTLTGAYEGYADWFAKSSERTLDTYLEFVEGFLGVLSTNATVLIAFAVLGVALERYGRDEPRWLVMFMTYCGVASLMGYPLGTDIQGAWAWVATHVVVPLAVPAAVGVAWLYREAMAARVDGDDLAAAVFAVVLLLAALQVGVTAADDVYRNPTADDNELVQYAQPYDDLDPVVETLDRAAAGGAPPAVLYYGPSGDAYDTNVALVSKRSGTAFWDVRPNCSVWSNSQPMNWYFAVADATVDCQRSATDLRSAVENDPPPVIFAVPDDPTVPEAALEASYEKEVYYTRTIGRELVVYTHESWT